MEPIDSALGAILEMELARFLGILRVELEHLEQHLGLMVSGYHDKERRREVTAYVCKENVAVLESEGYGTRHFISVVDELDPGDYDSLDALIEDVRNRFKATIKQSGLCDASYVFADRKINKVARYVTECATTP